MIPDKMLVPSITPGMKQRYDLAANRIASGGLIVLEIIAPLAGQREIISGRVTPSIERVNVFDGKALCRMRFLTQAILAAALCTLTHEQPQGDGDTPFSHAVRGESLSVGSIRPAKGCGARQVQADIATARHQTSRCPR